MIEAILPAAASVAEARDDEAAVALFPAEEELIAGAVERRRREFASGRDCAHRALAGLGLEPGPVGAGAGGEPLWPKGVVGSIAHCHGYRGCAVARTAELRALGIDAEPHQPLSERLVERLATPAERERLATLAKVEPTVHWDRILFSAKEAAYKAWAPLAGRELGFAEIAVDVSERRTFVARRGAEMAAGRWLVADGLLLTAVALAA